MKRRKTALKRDVEELAEDAGSSRTSNVYYAKRWAEAAHRFESGDYDEDDGLSRLLDAYSVAYVDEDKNTETFLSCMYMLLFCDLRSFVDQAREQNDLLPKVPPVPIEEVAEAIIDYGHPFVDGEAL